MEEAGAFFAPQRAKVLMAASSSERKGVCETYDGQCDVFLAKPIDKVRHRHGLAKQSLPTPSESLICSN
jgi:hypothetical protein